MADQNLNILLRLKDDFTKGMSKVNKNLDGLSDKMRSVSRELRKVSTDMTIIGGLVTGGFGLSIRTASEYSLEARNATQQLDNTLKNLQISIATSVLPTFNELVNRLTKAVEWFKALPQGVRDAAIQFTFLGGVLLIAGGFLAKMLSVGLTLARAIVDIGKALTGLAATNPVLAAIIASMGVMLFLTYELLDNWDKLKGKVQPVADAFDIAMNPIKAGFHAVRGYLEDITGSMADLAGLDKVGQTLKSMAREDYSGINKALNQAPGGTTKSIDSLAGKLKDLKNFIDELKNALTFDAPATGSPRPGGFLQGFELGLQEVLQDLSNFQAMATNIVKQTAGNMQTMFSDLFFNVMTGKFEDLGKVFDDFGKAVLRTLANIAAQMVALGLINDIAGSFGYGFNTQTGTLNKLPSTAPVTAGVNAPGIRAPGAPAAAGGTGSIVVVIQAWDASDIQRNWKMIEARLIQSIQSNGPLRGAIRNG